MLFQQYAEAGREEGGVTVLLTHRFTTARAADLIVVLDGGRFTEVGAHDTLSQVNGLYAAVPSADPVLRLTGRTPWAPAADELQERGGVMNVERLVEIAVEVSLKVGGFLREQFRQQPLSIRKGTRYDRVTEIDGLAEESIRTGLLAACPDSVVIGEENGVSGRGDVRWYVDPIDGTYNFARGIPLFCVSIGVVTDGAARGGCVYDPVRDEMFTAGGGDLRINGEPVRWQGHGPPLLLTDLAERHFHSGTGSGEYCGLRQIGSSALALAWVAAGRADLAANLNVYAWDVAAGRVLVEAVGGGYVGLPDDVLRTDRRGGFVAWGPQHVSLGRNLEERLRRAPIQDVA